VLVNRINSLLLVRAKNHRYISPWY
jgi:hypothetical protein